MMVTTEKNNGPVPSSGSLLSLCMIVKNEERTLGDCLRSVGGVVDEMVIVDTGSTDATVAVAESFGASVSSFPWNGSFADARNASLARATCAFVLYLDADERLEQRDRDRLRELVRHPRSDVYELTIVSPMTEGRRLSKSVSDQPRLFRRDARFEFRYRIHETVLPSVLEAGGTVSKADITIHHVGYDVPEEVLDRKKLRNIEQLEIDVREHPTDTHVMKKYAQTLLALGSHDEASERIGRMVQTIDGGACGVVPAPRRAAMYCLYADALMRTGDNTGAERWALASLEVLADQNMAHYFLSKIYERLERYDEALGHLDAIALETDDAPVTAGEDDVTPILQDVCCKRAALYRAMGRPESERREFEAALRIDPAMTTALAGLAVCMEQEQKFTQALSLITRACETDPADGNALYFRARILYQMGRHDEALRDARAAFDLGETGDPLLRLWIMAAREQGREGEALAAYALMTERHPGAADVLMAYIQQLVQRNALAVALDAIDRSLPAVTDGTMHTTLAAIRAQLAVAAQDA